MTVYSLSVKNFGWNIRDIDETNLETLLEFIFHKTKPDSNTRIINGKVYKRATKPPSWL